MSHNYHHHCGCAACGKKEGDMERHGEYIDWLVAHKPWRDEHKAEADESNDGLFDGEHYSAVERALADPAEVPTDKLVGSDAMATVLRLAKVHGEAREAELRRIAEAEYERSAAA